MSDNKKRPGVKRMQPAKWLEKEIKCPYLRVAYNDRLSCEAPADTGATCCILYFNNLRNLRDWVEEECFSLRENECPLRHLLNEQYGVDGY